MLKSMVGRQIILFLNVGLDPIEVEKRWFIQYTISHFRHKTCLFEMKVQALLFASKLSY